MNILSYLKNKPYLTIIVLVFVMLGFTSTHFEITIMEARNFITAREMIEHNHWLLTTMNEEARYQKPPLPTWLTAISALIFGTTSIFVFRLPALLMVIMTGVFSYKLSRFITSKTQHQFINALITITSLYVIVIIFEAPWDIFTHGFMLISIYFLFQILSNKKFNIKTSIFAALAFAASISSKGPIALYALFLPFLIAYGFSYRYKLSKRQWIHFIAVVCFGLIIGSFWFIYVRVADPNEFLAITNKETSNWSSYQVKPFYYYWSFFTQSGIWTIPAFVSLLYPYLKSRVSNLKAYKFTFFWTIAAVILLSLVPEKKSRYLMPVLIPLALNTGFYIEYLIRSYKTLKLNERWFAFLHFQIITFICFALPIVGFFLLKESIETNWILFAISCIIFYSLGIVMQTQLIKKDMSSVFIFSVLLFVFVFALGTPQLKVFYNKNYTDIKSIKTSYDIDLYSYNYIAPEVIWKYGKSIPNIKQDSLNYKLPKNSKFGLLASFEYYPERDSILQNKYTIELINKIDTNTAEPNTRAHKERLEYRFYILTEK